MTTLARRPAAWLLPGLLVATLWLPAAGSGLPTPTPLPAIRGGWRGLKRLTVEELIERSLRGQ